MFIKCMITAMINSGGYSLTLFFSPCSSEGIHSQAVPWCFPQRLLLLSPSRLKFQLLMEKSKEPQFIPAKGSTTTKYV